MNKEHWNSLYLDGDVADIIVKQLIDISYELVLGKLKESANGDTRGIIKRLIVCSCY